MRDYASPKNAYTNCGTGLGSAVVVSGSSGNNALVTCGYQGLIQELDEPDGATVNDPLLEIALTTKVYRAYPLIVVGEY